MNLLQKMKNRCCYQTKNLVYNTAQDIRVSINVHTPTQDKATVHSRYKGPYTLTEAIEGVETVDDTATVEIYWTDATGNNHKKALTKEDAIGFLNEQKEGGE